MKPDNLGIITRMGTHGIVSIRFLAGLRDAYVYAGCRQAKDILMPLANFISHIALNSNRDLFQSTLSVEQGGMNEVFVDILWYYRR